MIPPISERQARHSILVTVLFGPVGRHLLLTLAGTWRGWSLKPAWFWRPFTAVSLLVAGVASIGWPWLGGAELHRSMFGESTSSPDPLLHSLTYPVLCYLIWSLMLAPHAVARLVAVITSARKSHEGGK